MTLTRIPPAELPVSSDDDASVAPVSAVTGPIEDRVATELSATLQDWLHGLPGRSVRRRRDNRRK